jgi:hypothetical protein
VAEIIDIAYNKYSDFYARSVFLKEFFKQKECFLFEQPGWNIPAYSLYTNINSMRADIELNYFNFSVHIDLYNMTGYAIIEINIEKFNNMEKNIAHKFLIEYLAEEIKKEFEVVL